MSPELAGFFRGQLIDRRRRLQSATHEAGPEAEALEGLLGAVDDALSRIEHGSYGLCEVCHDDIEADRLVADPLTCFCLDHLTEGEQRALEHDLGLASRIQGGMLPRPGVTCCGWEVHHHYRPAGAVSGDVCDLVPDEADDGRLTFVIGDVAGKGVAASMLGAQIHAMFRSLGPMRLPIEEAVARADRIFAAMAPPSHYATLVAGQASSDGDLSICNAGHIPPVVLRSGQTTTLAATGMPLGLFPAVRHGVTRLTLQPGDSLVAFTDGVTEARSPSGEEFGVARAQSVLEGAWGASAEGLVGHLLDGLRQFTGGARPEDDLTVMAVQRAG